MAVYKVVIKFRCGLFYWTRNENLYFICSVFLFFFVQLSGIIFSVTLNALNSLGKRVIWKCAFLLEVNSYCSVKGENSYILYKWIWMSTVNFRDEIKYITSRSKNIIRKRSCLYKLYASMPAIPYICCLGQHIIKWRR